MSAGGATFLVGDEPAEWDAKGPWLEICQLQREDIDFFSTLVAERT